MPFGELTHVGPKKHELDGDQDRMNPFAAAMVASWQRGLSPNYFD